MTAFSLPDLSGRTYVVTGANTGIGRVTARELARAGAEVVLACRSRTRTEPALEEIRSLDRVEPRFVELDLASLRSVETAAGDLLASTPRIDGLINNAGLAGHPGSTHDGFELTFGVNHLGHFYLTQLLLDRIRSTESARIITVASRAHTRARSIPWDHLQAPTRSTTGLGEYSVSKLCNVLFNRELARRELEAGSGVIAHALHPGVVATDIWRRLPGPLGSLAKRFMITDEEGALTTLHCATSDDAATTSGDYWDRSRRKRTSSLGRDDALARLLWERSCAWCGIAPADA